MFTPLIRLFESSRSSLKLPRPSLRRAAFFRPLGELLERREMLTVRLWDGGAISNNWTSAANWVGDVVPVAGDDLVFPAGAPDKTADNTYNDGTLFNTITLGGGYTLKGNRINLGAGGIIDNSGTSDIIKSDLILGGGGRTISVGAGSTLFIDGALSGGALIKQGAGDLSLRANNTYSGLTQVNAGRLFVTKDEALGSTASGTTVKTGAQLIADHSATLLGTLDIDEPITLEDGSKLRALRQVELNGPITLLGTPDISQEAATEELFIDGQISGPGGLNLIAQNKLWLRGSDFNHYSGTTSVTGDVRLDNSNDTYAIPGDLIIQMNSAVTFMASGQFGEFTSRSVTIRSGGELRLNGQVAGVSPLILNGGKVSTGLTGRLRLNNGGIIATSTASGPARIEGNIETPQNLLDNQIITVADGPLLTDLIVDGTFTGNANLVKEGAGVLELSVTDRETYVFQYIGSVVVNAGTMIFNGNLADFGQGVALFGGRLSGTGTMGSFFDGFGDGRILAPGSLSNPGILHISSFTTSPQATILRQGSTFQVRLNGPVAGTGHDQLDVKTPYLLDNRKVFLRGASLAALVGAGASPGDQFRIINLEGTGPVVLDSLMPGFVDPATGISIPQGGIFTTASGVKLSMDYAGGTGNDVVLTYVNTRTAVENLVVTPQTIVEGGSVLATGHLTDPDLNDQLTLLVNWGDGTPTATFHPGRDPFALSHQYRDNGDYTPHLTWFDNHGEGNSRDLFVTVNNATPQVFAGLGAFLAPSQNLVRSGFFLDPGADTWTATVDYGDGAGPQALKLQGDSFHLRHRYQQPGTYTVTVMIFDDDGDVGTATFTVEVEQPGLNSSLVDLAFASHVQSVNGGSKR